ncbi:hypothetical protein GGI21_005793, partial [Coemansia aciculifera]
RPKLLSSRDESSIARMITSGAFDTAAQVARELRLQNGPPISVDTIRRALKSKGLRSAKK